MLLWHPVESAVHATFLLFVSQSLSRIHPCQARSCLHAQSSCTNAESHLNDSKRLIALVSSSPSTCILKVDEFQRLTERAQ